MKNAVLALMILLSSLLVSGCASQPARDQELSAMVAVRLATVAAVQGDPARAQRVVAECDALIAQVDAGESIAFDLLAPLLQTRIAEASLKPAERALLYELVSVAEMAVQAPGVLPEDTRERLLNVLGWVRAAAYAQALAANGG